MRIDPASDIGPHHFQADTGEVERGNCENEKQPF